MGYTVGSLVEDASEYLANRTFVTSKANEWVRKAVLELSRDYEFQGLQSTGPLVQLVPGQSAYNFGYFETTADQGLDISKIMSFFLYYQVPFIPVSSTTTATGVNLTRMTIEDMEQILNIESIPIKYGIFNGQIYIGYCPDQAYTCYVRYQKEHPFPNAKTINAGNDPILLDDEWEDICGYATALRGAISLRLYDIAAGLRQQLYGDPKFQLSGGTEGAPGLIFMRTSQRQRFAERSTSRLRLAMPGQGGN